MLDIEWLLCDCWVFRGTAAPLSLAAPLPALFPASIFLLQELEGQVASNKDLKLLDMLRYYMRDSQAARVRGGPRANLRAGGQGAEPPGRAERHGPWVRDPVPLPAPGLLSWQQL